MPGIQITRTGLLTLKMEELWMTCLFDMGSLKCKRGDDICSALPERHFERQFERQIQKEACSFPSGMLR